MNVTPANSRMNAMHRVLAVGLHCGLLCGLMANPATAVAATAAFSGTTLTVPEVLVNGNYYSATLTLTGTAPLTFTLAGATPLGSGDPAAAATFSAGQVLIPVVSFAGKTYSATLVQTGSSPFTFQLASATLTGGGGGSPVGTITSQGNGNCVSLPLPDTGRLASYEEASATLTGAQIEFTEQFLTATASQLVFVTDYTSEVGGIITLSDNHTTLDFVVDGNWRWMSNQEVDNTTVTSGTTQDVFSTITYDPPFLNGPVDTVCEGMSWSSGTTTQTIVISGQPTVSQPYGVVTSVVESIDDSVTVPGGTFTTVRTKHTDSDGLSFTLSWIDRASGLMVRSERVDESGSVNVTIELMDLQ